MAPPQKPETTWGEILEQMRENADDKARLDAWKPRAIELGQSVPTTGDPDAFESGTPEHKLAEFLSYWKVRNYGYMAKCLSCNLGYSDRKLPAIIKEHYSSKRLKAFEFKEIKDNAPAITEIEADLIYQEEDNVIEKSMMFRLINEDAKGNPAVGGKLGTSWVVYNWFI